MPSKPHLIICDKCGGKYGEWDFRKTGNRRMPICKACETDKKAAALRKKQEKGAANHLQVIEAEKRITSSWEDKAKARIND